MDYFSVNNGSVLGLPTDLLETNALSFSDCMEHMKCLLISASEPSELADQSVLLDP